MIYGRYCRNTENRYFSLGAEGKNWGQLPRKGEMWESTEGGAGGSETEKTGQRAARDEGNHGSGLVIHWGWCMGNTRGPSNICKEKQAMATTWRSTHSALNAEHWSLLGKHQSLSRKLLTLPRVLWKSSGDWGRVKTLTPWAKALGTS